MRAVPAAKANPGDFRVMFRGGASASGEPGLRAFQLLREAALACQAEGAATRGDPCPWC